jgi:hypothetical protein
MRQVGKNMRDELRLLDQVARISFSVAEIEEKLAETAGGRLPQSTAKTASHSLDGSVETCYLCGQSSRTLFRQAPLDEFYSKIASELDQEIDMMLYHHPKEGECLLVLEEDPCFTLDYFPAKMSVERLRERSWRRHVAAVLEEQGLLS